nr:MAG TPA: hypothetical protein [Caudoviricetes sp.]
MSTEHEKRDFEAWARSRNLNTDAKPNGGYYTRETNLAALAWSRRAQMGEMGYWVSAYTQPPPTRPILFFDGETVQPGFFADGRYFNDDGKTYPPDEISYWREMPEPPYGPIRAAD